MRLGPGMTIVITVCCRRCGQESISIPNKDPEEAELIAEKAGWYCTIRHGWTCPNCR